jgi:multimeric flavodoxin WrbA
MRALLLNGARDDGEAVDRAAGLLEGRLADRGWEVETITLRDVEIRGCVGCFACWIKTPGECIIDDTAREVARLTVQSDLVAWLTPVTFGGYSSELKKAIDRTVPIASPFFEVVKGEIHHRKRYEDIARLLLLGSAADPNGAEATTFRALHERNALNIRPPAHAAEIVRDGADDATITATLSELLGEVL